MTGLVLALVAAGAFLWAKMEIEIEGKAGWAEDLPTWKVEKHLLLDIFFGGRALTGYHLWAFSFVLAIFHLPFAWAGGTWTWRGEVRLLGFYAIFWVLEDLLWFLLNPHYGWRGLSPGRAWWHKRWFLGLPVDYWVFTAMGIACIGF